VAGEIGKVRERTRSGRTFYYVDLRPHGRVFSIPDPGGAGPIPISDRGTAERILESIRQALLDGKPMARALAPWLAHASPQIRVGPRYAAWIEHLQERVRTGERSAEYVDKLRRYGLDGGYLDPIRELPVFSVTYGHLEDFDRELVAHGLAPKTRAHVLGALHTFFRWLKRRGEIDSMPEIPTVTVPEYVPHVLEPADQQRVIGAIPERIRGIYLALAYHGLRPSEAIRLGVSDYDFSTGIIQARRTKNKRSRVIPASGELRAWIERFVDPAGRLTGAPLFANPRGFIADKRWTWDALRDAWKRACRDVGVEARLYEGTKHSSATAARRRGVALEVIQEAFGHADIRSTLRYARAAELAPVEVLSVAHLSPAKEAAEKAQ
jgi:integrase